MKENTGTGGIEYNSVRTRYEWSSEQDMNDPFLLRVSCVPTNVEFERACDSE
jgi:hypothetical protein